MSERTAKTVVLLAGALMFAAVAIKRDTIPDPFRFAWAAGVITLGLSVLADISPEVAGPAALLVLIAVYWRNKGVIGSVPGLSGKSGGIPSTPGNRATSTAGTSAAGTAARTAQQTIGGF